MYQVVSIMRKFPSCEVFRSSPTNFAEAKASAKLFNSLKLPGRRYVVRKFRISLPTI